LSLPKMHDSNVPGWRKEYHQQQIVLCFWADSG
jgi:hypothetical protein